MPLRIILLLLIPPVTYGASVLLVRHGEALVSLIILPTVATVFWWFIFASLYKKIRGRAARVGLWVLAPLGLCYPAWWVVAASCALFFNWCGAPL